MIDTAPSCPEITKPPFCTNATAPVLSPCTEITFIHGQIECRLPGPDSPIEIDSTAPPGAIVLDRPPCGTPDVAAGQASTPWRVKARFVYRRAANNLIGEPCDPKANPPLGLICHDTLYDNPPPGFGW
jgi:hypothetical protein